MIKNSLFFPEINNNTKIKNIEIRIENNDFE